MLKLIFATLVATMTSAAASATTYTFTAGLTTGMITNGSMSARDAGFYLLENLTFERFLDEDTDVTFTNLISDNFAADAAFNLLTKAFISCSGSTFIYGYGNFDVSNGTDSFLITGVDGGVGFIGYYSKLDLDTGIADFGSVGDCSPFTVNVPTSPVAEAVPEPATWAMMLVGVGMVGAAARYSRRRVKVSLV